MRQVMTSVQPKAADHPRAGQAGVVWGLPEDPAKVEVRWDSDLEVTTEDVAALRQL